MSNVLLKHGLLAVFLGIFAFSCSSVKPFESPNLSAAIATHKQIAILPFDVRFNESYKQDTYRRGSRNNSKEYWVEQERLAGLDMQKELFMDISKQVAKGKYMVAVKDFISTNKILQEQNIPMLSIKDRDKSKLARILGVDAVIWGQTDIIVNNSNFGFTPSNSGVETLASLFDAQSGEILWSDKTRSTPSSRLDTPHSLSNQTLSTISRRLPYRIAKK